MGLPLSSEVGAVYDEARDLCAGASQPLGSAHLLLALFTVPNRAAVFLTDRDVTVEQLLERLSATAGEPENMLDRVRARAERIAMGSRADELTSLHLLAALVRESRSQAVSLLREAGVNVSAIRTSIMSYATGSKPLPRRFQDSGAAPTTTSESVRAQVRRQRAEHAPSPIGFHPSLGIRPPKDSGPAPSPPPEPSPNPPRASRSGEARDHHALDGAGEREDAPAARGPSWSQGLDRSDSARPASRIRRTPPSAEDREPTGDADTARRDARETARSLAARLFQGRPSKRSSGDTGGFQVDDAGVTTEVLDRVDVAEDAADAPTTSKATEAARERLAAQPQSLAEESSIAEEVRFDDPLEADDALAEAYALDPEHYPNLTKFGRNLTQLAARGEIDRVIGRDREILQLIDIVGKRRSNNPVLVGPAGVGKTAIVEGLSREFVKLAHKGNRLGKRAIIELELGRLLSGTHLRGSFAERLTGIKDEVEAADGQVIVFLDELHSWMNAGGGGDGTDAAGELKTALARGRFPCIGATTQDEFRKFVESDPAFERRFQVVFVEEPDVATATEIANGVRGHYERHHGVRYDARAVDAAVRLSHRYIYQRRLPDKAIGVLDLAGSRAARTGRGTVDREAVAEIVAEMAGLPVERLTQTDRARFLQMESHLRRGIVGHEPVVQAVSDVIRRNYAGFRGRRPIGSLLFLGPTGVGKTEMVKVLADFLFHDRDAIVRLDMSEFMEAHSVSRMLGAPPGYVGHDQGGQLTEAVRSRPYQIVLLDEIEKAHADVLNVLLQLLDEGRLTDGRGRVVDFSNTVVVMTSNLGSDAFSEAARRPNRSRIGFGESARGAHGDHAELRETVLTDARAHFTPELWNRIDEKLVFMPLDREQVAQIAQLQLDDSRRRLDDESGIELDFEPSIIEFLIERGGFDPELGARPMRQTIQRFVEGAVARMILSGEVRRGDRVRVVLDEGQVRCVPA